MAEGNAITVKIGAETDGIEQGIRNIQQSISKLGSKADEASKGFDLSFGKIGAAAAVAGAAVKVGMMAVEAATAGARAVVDGFGQAIDLGGKLNDLSSRTGESAGNLLVLQRAFENTGVSGDKVGTSINKLQKFMAEAAAGGAEQSATMSALGISMKDLEGKTPTEQMQVFAKQIAGISDPAERARAAMEVFGKSGGELLPMLNNFAGEIDGAKGQLGSLPGVMDRSASAMDSLGDNFSAIKNKTMEFAAGFLESALPALNAFTTSLTGVDAAGWGQKLMGQVMSVADFLIGAFKAPMPAIEALGAALIAGVKTAGNNYLNSLIDAGKFLSAFFSSDLPGIISGVLGNTLIKAFVDSAKYFIDSIRDVIKAFETWLGAAITNVVDFFTTKFSGVLNAVAQDFQAAMKDPIGFVSGKLDSALKGVMENGGNTFQTSFDKAGGSALDKISAGLGAVSDEYGAKIVDGSIRAKDEFGKLVDSMDKSDKDFFGAKEATTVAAEKLSDVAEIGKKLREDFEKSAESASEAENNTSGAAADAEAIATSFNKAEGSTKKIKEELSESAKLMKSIDEAQQKNRFDRGGKLEDKAKSQIESGNFAGARRTAAKLGRQEDRVKKDDELRGQGQNRDRRSVEDIAKDYGLRAQLGETSSQLRDRIFDARAGKTTADKFGRSIAADADPNSSLKSELQSKPSLKDRMAEGTKSFRDRMAGKETVDKPGQSGKTDTAARGGDKTSGKSSLDSMVQSIQKLLEKTEPRLPVAALV